MNEFAQINVVLFAHVNAAKSMGLGADKNREIKKD